MPNDCTPYAGPVRFTLVYYHDSVSVRLDNDNILKPIQDALNGVVYVDDSQITDTQVRKTCIDGHFRVRGAPIVLMRALSAGSAFLHIVIDFQPDHAELLK